MRIIPFEINSGKYNMEKDSEILENAIASGDTEPIFRLYGWSPQCISLGRNQKDNFLNYELLKSEGVDVVRRLTGGRALLHDMELTYSYVCPISILDNGENVKASYMEISSFLIDKMKKLGIELGFGSGGQVHTKFDYCMLISTGADLTYQGKKLIGSAQLRKDGYILQHGSILYDLNEELIRKIFPETFDKSSITTVKEINPQIKFEDLVNIFS